MKGRQLSSLYTEAQIAVPLLVPDGWRSLEEMVSALQVADRHPLLIVATTDTDSLRQQLEELLSRRLEPKTVRCVSVTAQHLDILLHLSEEVLANASVISLSGLTYLSFAERRKAYEYLNYRRELLGTLNRPLIIWTMPVVTRELMHYAPDFWAFRSHHWEFRTSPEAIVKTALHTLDSETPAQDAEEVEAQIALSRRLLRDLQQLGVENDALLAKLKLRLGQQLFFLGRQAEARPLLHQALEHHRRTGDRLGEANTLKAIGDVLCFRDEYDQALEHYREALGLYRQVGARLGEANVLKAQGDVLAFLKRNQEALEKYEAALGLYRQVGARLGEANTLGALSRLALQQGRDDEAQQLLRQAVSLHEAIGDRYSVAADLGNFGLTLREMGRTDEARPYLLQAAEILDQIGLQQPAEQMRRAAGEAREVALHPAVARMAPLLLGVVAVAGGQADDETAGQVRAAIAQMARADDWAALAGALQRVIEGERDPQALTQGLDEVDQQALALVLAALEDEQARQLLEALAAASGQMASEEPRLGLEAARLRQLKGR